MRKNKSDFVCESDVLQERFFHYLEETGAKQSFIAKQTEIAPHLISKFKKNANHLGGLLNEMALDEFLKTKGY